MIAAAWPVKAQDVAPEAPAKIGLCVACHGAEGKGNPALGAPNLTDKVWLHGSGEVAIMDVIMKGRTNQMPAHRNLLSADKIRLLSAYVYSLSAPKK